MLIMSCFPLPLESNAIKRHLSTVEYKINHAVLVNYATKFKLRCERRLGEMLAQEIQRGDLNKKQSNTPMTLLSDLGIDRNHSSRAQRIASIPEEKFESLKEIPPERRRTPAFGSSPWSLVIQNLGYCDWHLMQERFFRVTGLIAGIW